MGAAGISEVKFGMKTENIFGFVVNCEGCGVVWPNMGGYYFFPLYTRHLFLYITILRVLRNLVINF